MDELRELVKTHTRPPAIISVTETWAKNDEPDSFYTVDGYSLHRADRTDQAGGGVILYIRRDIPHNQLQMQLGNTAGESVWLTAKLSTCNLAIGGIYRAPRTEEREFCRHLEMNIRESLATSDHVLLLGDFNAKHSQWHSDDETDTLGERLHCLFAAYNLHQATDFPTYLHQGHLKSCLDLVVSSLEPCEVTVQSSAPLGNADHVVLFGRLTLDDKHQATNEEERLDGTGLLSLSQL